MKITTKLAVLTVTTLLTSLSAQAAATRIAFVDQFATARGNAFTATADNPSAVFYNGAGLTQGEGTKVIGNVFAISLGYEADTLAHDDMDDDFQPVPSLFISHNVADSPLALGFGIYAPFALGSDWGSDAAFTIDPRVPYEADLEYIKYHAVIAWQISDTLSVAAGASFDDTNVNIKATAVEFDGDDNTTGFSASLLWKPSVKHAFGLNYQAKTKANYDGTANIMVAPSTYLPFDATTDLTFPESIVFGYSYRPNEKWNIEFNLDWTNWDRVNKLTLETAIPLPSYELNWESAFIWELGATRYFDNGWHVSAGYTFVENAVPDADFLPIVPDSDRHFLAIGVGRNYENFSWQLTYQQAFASKRSVTGNNLEIAPGTSAIDGDYDLDSRAIGFSVGYQF
jgi:long-chain fatty acid transport protein